MKQNGFARAAAEDDTLAAGVNTFGFEPWTPMGQTDSFGYPGGPGYVWHCHIVDHEDNEMMRPDEVVPIGGTIGPIANPGTPPTRTYVKGVDY